jgi:hypothetical protein
MEGVKVGVSPTAPTASPRGRPRWTSPSDVHDSAGADACVKVVVPECAAPLRRRGHGHDGDRPRPGARAQLYFAGTDVETATEAEFAANILALRNTYGCDIIVDDLTFLEEGAFQDGPIAQAVNSVKASGALFFSSAGSSGRKFAGTSGTWEGDFLNSGTTIDPFCYWDPDCWQSWEGLPIHSFNGATGGTAANSNALTADADYGISLKWSDPSGRPATTTTSSSWIPRCRSCTTGPPATRGSRGSPSR